MGIALRQKGVKVGAQGSVDLAKFLPPAVFPLANPQTDIPRIAKDEKLIRLIEHAIQQIPTTHTINRGDARQMTEIEPESVHLVVTSPPYWTLKEYRVSNGQMGHVEDYEEFLNELDKVWSHCFRALVPGGRLVCVVGDVCLSRRENNGRHYRSSAPRFNSRTLPKTGVRQSRSDHLAQNFERRVRGGERFYLSRQAV
jgi:hypothetical protein